MGAGAALEAAGPSLCWDTRAKEQKTLPKFPEKTLELGLLVTCSIPYCLLNLHWAPNFCLKTFFSHSWGVGGGPEKVPRVGVGKGDMKKTFRTDSRSRRHLHGGG